MYIKWIVYYLNESIKSVTLWFIYVGVSYCGSLGCHCCSLWFIGINCDKKSRPFIFFMITQAQWSDW